MFLWLSYVGGSGEKLSSVRVRQFSDENVLVRNRNVSNGIR
jgi:hypothetical protein